MYRVCVNTSAEWDIIQHAMVNIRSNILGQLTSDLFNLQVFIHSKTKAF